MNYCCLNVSSKMCLLFKPKLISLRDSEGSKDAEDSSMILNYEFIDDTFNLECKQVKEKGFICLNLYNKNDLENKIHSNYIA